MVKQMFVNLPVKDLNKTKEFFTKLGFTFNPQFTDENAACMVIGENLFAMLMVEKFFKTFIKKEIPDTSKTTGVLLALAFASRAQVDDIMKKALAAGATEPDPIEDMGWMYSRSFEDPNGHMWGPFYMNEKEMPKEMK